MQIVGQTCAISGHPIMMASEGIGCRNCGVAYLRGELEGSGTICPRCQQDMTAQEGQVVLERQQTVANIHRRGSARFAFVGIAILFLFAATLASTFIVARAGGPSTLPGIGGLVAWVWARGGNRGPRWWLRGILAINLVVCLAAVSMALRGPAIPILATYGFVGIMLAIALVFLFTRSLNLYLDDQIRHPQGRK